MDFNPRPLAYHATVIRSPLCLDLHGFGEGHGYPQIRYQQNGQTVSTSPHPVLHLVASQYHGDVAMSNPVFCSEPARLLNPGSETSHS